MVFRQASLSLKKSKSLLLFSSVFFVSMKVFWEKNHLLFLIFLLTLIKGFLWLGLVPALQAPDAERHFSTIIWFAEPREKDWKITENAKIIDPLNIDTYNVPPEYYSFLKSYEFEETRFNPNNHQQFSENNKIGLNENTFIAGSNLSKHFNATPATIVEYPPLYYIAGSWVYRIFHSASMPSRIMAVQIYTLFLSLIAIFFAYKASLVMNFSRRGAAFFAGIFSFQPMFSFIGVSVNPDNMLILGITMFIFFALLILKNPFSWKNILGIIVASMIAIFSKTPGIAVIPFLIILAGFKIFQFKKTQRLRFKIFMPILLLLVGLLIILITRLNILSMLSPSWLKSSFSAFGAYAQMHFSLSEQYNIFASYWGLFGWFDHPLSTMTYAIIFSITMIAIASLLRFILKNRKTLPSDEKNCIYFMILVIFLFHLSILFAEFNYFKDTKLRLGLQGRYFLPTMLPFFLLFSQGLKNLAKRFSFDFVLGGLFFLMILLNIYSLIAVIIPSYYL